MGDHCYNLGMEDGTKGDAYMNALQPLTATCPWIPVIGEQRSLLPLALPPLALVWRQDAPYRALPVHFATTLT